MNANNPLPQAVFTPVTRHAIFIVATLSPVPAHLAAVRAWCGDIAAVVRSVGKRAPAGNLTCVCGFGSEALGYAVRRAAPSPAASVQPDRQRGARRRRHARRHPAAHPRR